MEERIMPDVEIENPNLSLESFEEMLSEQDELLVSQIDALQRQMDDSHDLMYDLMEAVKKGAMDYVDAMTDTGESFNKIKDPDAVKALNDVEIDKRSKPTDIESNANWQTRNMSDAKTNPFDKNVSENTKGMSESGKVKFERYKEAYCQRLKTNSVTSNGENNSINSSNSKQNFESLSGLRNYRIGPIVPMPDIETIKEGYKAAVAEGKTESAAGYIRKENFKAFDNALIEKFGFSSRAEAEQWRKSNHLTIHETGDGMYLVPTDVHDSSSHKGYCSKLSDILNGKEGAEDAMKQYIRDEKIAYVKHEAQVRGIRVVKGVGISIVKDLLKHVIANLVVSFYEKRILIKELGFLNYIKTALVTCWEKVKTKAINVAKNIGANIVGAIGTELLNAINDFLLGTFKRLFSVIRQMFGSIKNAFKIMCNKDRSWQEKVFEATKVLSAGAVAILGFSLNEIIEKGLLSMAIPANIASFVAECLAGLFAGIFSNIVLMLFDHTKDSLKVRDAQLQLSLLRSQSIFIDNLRIDMEVLKSSRDIYNAYKFFGNEIYEIKETRDNIRNIENRIEIKNRTTANLLKTNNHFNNLKNKIEMMTTSNNNTSIAPLGLERRNLTNKIALLDENKFIALGRKIEQNFEVLQDEYDKLGKIASPVVENEYLWGIIKTTNVEKSLEGLLTTIQGVAESTLTAFKTNGENLNSILELMKISVSIENDLYKQLEDSDCSKESIANLLHDLCTQYNIDNQTIENLFEQSYNRTLTLRARIKNLREEILERILKYEEKFDHLDETIKGKEEEITSCIDRKTIEYNRLLESRIKECLTLIDNYKNELCIARNSYKQEIEDAKNILMDSIKQYNTDVSERHKKWFELYELENKTLNKSVAKLQKNFALSFLISIIATIIAIISVIVRI